MTARIEDLSGRSLLLVASTGGHLAQIVALAKRLNVAPSSKFYSFDSDQSRSLLEPERAVLGPYVAPRDVGGVLRAAVKLTALGRSGNFDAIVSTGAGVAISAAIAARACGLPFYFVESISRFNGPSLSGRMINYWPGAHRFTQHSGWASRRWSLTEPLLGRKASIAKRASGDLTDRPLNILVSLGTIRPYRFDRIVDAVLAVISDDDTVTWQLGVTSRDSLPGDAHQHLPHGEFSQLLSRCDVFVTHAGVGTIMQGLDEGAGLVVMPRRYARGEHVDDHQLQVAEMLRVNDLAVVVEANLRREDLLKAAR